MITLKTLKVALDALGFAKNGNVYEKQFAAFDCALKVDFPIISLFILLQLKGVSATTDG